MNHFFIQLFILLVKGLRTLFQTREELVLENLPLRQPLSIYRVKNIRPGISNLNHCFWIALKQFLSKWEDSLIIVQPETVVAWQKCRFKKHWTNISHKNRKSGRKHIGKEIKDLIYRIAGENNRGAPRIYSELLMKADYLIRK